MRVFCVFLFSFLSSNLFGQTSADLTLRGDFTSSDSIQIIEAYSKASVAVARMNTAMEAWWNVRDDVEDKTAERVDRWKQDPAFMEWLGDPKKLRSVRNRIQKFQRKFGKKVVLEVKKENKGRCTGWISAWTIPWGKVKIRLCEDFFVYRTHLQEKVLVHEMGHETGILFHHKVHGCRAARRAANSDGGRIAKKSTENYAWLAVGYLGVSCSSR